jgi:hypothetical protein
MPIIEVEGSEELLTRLRATLDSDAGPAPAASTFTSMKDLLMQEATDLEGDFLPFPDMPGMSVHVTGSLAVSTQYGVAEKRYRKTHGLGGKDDIPLRGQMRVSAEAYFDGHGVKGWQFTEGVPDAAEWPWSREKFIELYLLSGRFRDFITARWSHLSGAARKAREDVRGE